LLSLSLEWPTYTFPVYKDELVSFEILGPILVAYIRFQKFLKNLKAYVCVSPCDIQPNLLAVQKQGVRAKFSPT
jgi:hypothetical protein